MKVKNLNGTSKYKPIKKGYSSWKEFWEDKKGKKFNYCSCIDCKSPAEVGGHVQKAYSTDQKWYIIPLCKSCNKRKKEDIFEVRAIDLEEVNQ